MRRKRSVTTATTGLVLLFPGHALADSAYLREADAPHALFPEATSSARKQLDLSDAELTTLSRELGRRVDIRSYPYLEVAAGQRSLGQVFILDVLGQTLPITFAVGIDVDGKVRDLQVMTYREPRGDEIREPRFRRQFAGKRSEDPLTLGRDIDAVSGATISSRSATYATRKALALAAILRGRAPAR